MRIQLRGRRGRRASRPGRRTLRDRGQSLVEFALVLPILLLITLIALDFGRAFFAWVTVTNASRAGAAYAASHPNSWGASPDPNIVAIYDAEINTDLLPVNCDAPSPLPTPTFPDPSPNTYSLGARVSVSLTCVFHPLTPGIGNLIGFNIPITATTVYPVRAGEIANGPILNAAPSPSGSAGATPTPTPTSTASASPTPTPTPVTCNVPQLTGLSVSSAEGAWTTAGFTGTVTISPNGAKTNWMVTAQFPAYPSTPLSCTTNLQLTAKNN